MKDLRFYVYFLFSVFFFPGVFFLGQLFVVFVSQILDSFRLVLQCFF